jgi:SNF2 family DNA or RNA helicase
MRYKFKTKPYAHQVRALKFAIRKFKNNEPGVAFLMEPRTGKTKTTIDTLACLHHMYGLRKVLIVAPNRVLGTWVQEIAAHCPLVVQTIIWDADARQDMLPKSMGPYDMQIVLVNFEAFGQPGKRLPSGRRSVASGRFKHRQKLQRWVGTDNAAGVIDESHKIKNPSGKAANMIVSMRDLFRWRFILTGTPVTKAKRAFDIFMQWQWLNPARFDSWGPTVDTFRNHTGRWINRHGWPQWVGPKPQGMLDLQRGIHADGLVVRRHECFDLPPREDRIIRVPLKQSAKHYDEMAEEMVTQLANGKIATASIPLVVTLRLMQITSGHVGIPETRIVRGHPKLVSVPHRVGFEKIRVLKELLQEEMLERDEKVVIAARFVHDLNAITKLCKSLHLPVWEIRGKIHRRVSDESIRDFRVHDGAGAMVIQPSAASLGIDLSTAAHMVWYSLTPSYVDWTQACDRIALSRVSTTFTYLLATGTVDELAYETLQEDGNVSRAILDKPERILRHG